MNGGRVKDKTGVLLMKIAKMIKKSFVLYETVKFYYRVPSKYR
jgi:hypothetical protein